MKPLQVDFGSKSHVRADLQGVCGKRGEQMLTDRETEFSASFVRKTIPPFEQLISEHIFRHKRPKLPLSVWPLNPMVQGGKRKHTLGFP